MSSKRRKRLTTVSIAVAAGIFLYASPDARQNVAFLIEVLLNF